MKKAIALLLAAFLLLLCGCASQTNEKEGTAGQPAVSSDAEQEHIDAVPEDVEGTTGKNGCGASGKKDGKTDSTLPQENSGGEAAGVTFDGGNGNSGGNSGNTTTTKNNQEKEESTDPEKTTGDSGDSVTMPRVPIPQN